MHKGIFFRFVHYANHSRYLIPYFSLSGIGHNFINSETKQIRFLSDLAGHKILHITMLQYVLFIIIN